MLGVGDTGTPLRGKQTGATYILLISRTPVLFLERQFRRERSHELAAQTTPPALCGSRFPEQPWATQVNDRAGVDEIRILENIVDVVTQLERCNFPDVNVFGSGSLGPHQVRSIDSVAAERSCRERSRVRETINVPHRIFDFGVEAISDGPIRNDHLTVRDDLVWPQQAAACAPLRIGVPGQVIIRTPRHGERYRQPGLERLNPGDIPAAENII